MQDKVLIVEDNPEVVRLLKRALEKQGYRISVALDGEEALQKIIQEPPDLVLLDLGLPKLSGEEVCKVIRKRWRRSRRRLILLLML